MMPTSTPIIAAVAARAHRQVVDHFRAAGAIEPGKAVAYEAPRRLHRSYVRQLVRAGALVEAGEGVYWLDEASLSAFRKRRAGFVLAIAGTAAAVIAAIGLTKA